MTAPAPLSDLFGNSDVRRGQLRVWAILAIGALAVAGFYAPILALSRLPGIEGLLSWPQYAFEKGIITHVVFSIVVWYLAVFGALINISVDTSHGRGRMIEKVALILVGAAFILLLIPSLMDRGQPSLNNYIPVIIDPLYYVGIVALLIGLAIQNGLVVKAKSKKNTGALFPLKAVMVAYLAAIAAFIFSLILLKGPPPSEAFNEDLFWAGGHILQFVNTGLMLTGVLILAGGGKITPFSKAAFVLLGGGAVASLALFAFTDLTDGSQRIGFSDLKYLLAVPVLLVAVDLLHRRAAWLKSGFPAYVIVLAAITFAVGGVFGFFVDGADTRTPAHYHGVLGGVNIVFFGLFFTVFLPLLGRGVVIGRKVYALMALYAAGQILQCIGLFLAGGYGTPRKVAGAAQGLEDLGAILGMYLNGIGALIAVIGGIMFVVIVTRTLLKKGS